MRFALPILALFAATPALAQETRLSCTMTERCSGFNEGCNAVDRSFEFTLNPTTGAGSMIQQGAFFEGIVSQSGDTLHFIFVNSAGIETGTFSTGGDAIYSGNMQIGDRLSHYRLRGTCTDPDTPPSAPVDSK